MEKTRRSVDVYLRRLSEPVRAAMVAVDEVLVHAMPGTPRRLWVGTFWGGTHQEIIGYGDVTQTGRDGREVEWFTIGLARQQKHLSLYVNAVEDGEYLVHRYADRLGQVKVGSANVTFRRLEDVDLSSLRRLAAHAYRLR
jgi:hypothetical protein